MSKRFRYLISSILAAIGFYFFLSLPYESHYYGLLVGIVLVIFCFWFGLGIVFDKSIYIRLMSIVMPVGFFIGFALFSTLLPQIIPASLRGGSKLPKRHAASATTGKNCPGGSRVHWLRRQLPGGNFGR